MNPQIDATVVDAECSFSGSHELIDRARRSVARGADSTMRVLDYHLPLAIDRAEGARVWDVDGNELIDMNMGYGPLLFGHRPDFIVNAITEELGRRGTTLGFPHELSHQVAELVKKSFPSIDLLRFASTGTEVDQTAIRLARAFTGRSHLVLFEGHYHGSTDAVFHKYHAAPTELAARSNCQPISGTGGMNGAPQNAYVIPWNDIDALNAVLKKHGKNIAAVMMEPVSGNAGVIPPTPGYLEAVRKATQDCGALLIFDEVITGFRIARGGAQELYGLRADITTLSKALGGGIPISAVGGRSDIMQLMVDGAVFHGGVYSGTPLCLAAALTVQQEYDSHGTSIYRELQASTELLAEGLRGLGEEFGIAMVVQHVGAMLSCWIVKPATTGSLMDYRAVAEAVDTERYIAFQHAAQRSGVYFHPNCFEPWYISTTHTPEIIETVLGHLHTAIKRIL